MPRPSERSHPSCRHILLWFYLLIALLILDSNIITAQSGQTYFVATDGLDTNLGTLESPFGTIQHAVYSSGAGDTIYVRGGTYHEEIKITRSGTAGNPLRILAYNDEKPVIDGEYLLPSGPPATPSIINNPPIPPAEFVWTPLVKITGNYVEFRGFEVKRSRGRGIGVNGLPTAHNHNVIVSDCIVQGARNAGIHMIDTENILIERCEVTDAGNYASYSRSPFVLNWPVIVNMVSSRQITLRQSRIHHNWGEGVGADRDSEQITIEDNLIYNNYAMQLYVHRSQQITVQRNLIYHTNEAAFRRGSDPSQCIVINNETNFPDSISVNDVLIANNVVVGCRKLIASWGSGSTTPISNVTIENNTLVNAFANSGPQDAAAISIANASLTNMVIRNNVISQQGFLVAEAPQNPEVQFSNNAWSSQPPIEASGVGDWIGDPQLNNPNALLEPGAVQVNWYKPAPSSPLLTMTMGPLSYIISADVTGCSGWPLGGCPPPAAALISPLGAIPQGSPTFVWQTVQEATGYTLVVYHVEGNAIVFIQTVDSTNCSGNQCTLQAGNLLLSPGTYQWTLQAFNGDGVAPWSIYSP